MGNFMDDQDGSKQGFYGTFGTVTLLLKPEPIKTMPAGRRCAEVTIDGTVCGKLLSIYNKKSECNSHSVIDERYFLDMPEAEFEELWAKTQKRGNEDNGTA